MLKLIERISTFLRSQEVKPFALAVLVIGFFFLYMKVYFVLNAYSIDDLAKLKVNELMFWIGFGKNLLYFVMSFITALGASLITITVIIHSKDRKVPGFFALFDGAFSLFFFGNRIPEWWGGGEYGYIGLAFAWSIFTAFGLYFLAEMFYNDSILLAEKEERERETHKDLKTQIAELLAKVESLSQSLLNAEKRNDTLSLSNQELSQSLDDLSHKYDTLSRNLNGKQSETKNLVEQVEALRNRNKELQMELWERVNTRKIASKRGYITQLRNEGREQEAKQKERELELEIEASMEGIDSDLLNMSVVNNGNGHVH